MTAQDDDDVDRTDFSEPHLKTDAEVGPQGPHSEIEPAWILPDSPDGKVPVGHSTDMLISLANSGVKMFNVSHIEAQLLTATGKQVLKLDRYEYGQPLGPREQRSFRYPLVIDAETPLGEYTLVARAYYNTRDKEPFVSVVYNETNELVPPPPPPGAQLRMLQMALGGVGVVMLGALGVRQILGKSAPAGKAAAKKAGAAAGTGDGNEWLSGTLAGSENRSPKKKKKA